MYTRKEFDELLEYFGGSITLSRPIRFKLTPHSKEQYLRTIDSSFDFDNAGDIRNTIMQRLKLIKHDNKFNMKTEKDRDFVLSKLAQYINEIQFFEFEDRVMLINEAKKKLHEQSPFKFEPVDCVLWVKNEMVEANDYNPNSVAPPEMKLLEISILEDGYTQPVVTFDESEKRTVVDGFHRTRVAKECESVIQRVHGYVPVVTINEHKQDKGDRIASTIRHNRARGKHKVDSMSDIVVDLKRRNWSDEKIARQLGMDADEILRLTQISGLAEMFSDKEFSMSWEADQIDETDTLSLEDEIK